MAKKTRPPRRTHDKFPMARASDAGGPETPDAVKMEFARRLQRAMAAKRWTQSELARRCKALMPLPTEGQKQNKDFRRDMISHYINGIHLPSAPNLAVLAQALEVNISELLPKSAFPEAGRSPFAMTTLPDGRVSVRLERTFSAKTANKIWQLVQAEDAP